MQDSVTFVTQPTYVPYKMTVKLLATLVSISMCVTAFGDAKSDCIKALNGARMAGLPTNPTELALPKPSPTSLRIDALLAKADKVSRRNQPSLGDQIADDFAERDGKPRKLKPETPEQVSARKKDTLAIIEEIGKIDGLPSAPLPGQSVFGQMSSFGGGAQLTSLVRLELEAANSPSISTEETIHRLNLAHNLLSFYSPDASFTRMMQQVACEKIYYSGVLKLVSAKPELKSKIDLKIFARPLRASIQELLKGDFLNVISIWFKSSEIRNEYAKNGILTGMDRPAKLSSQWKLPSDKDSLRALTSLTKSYTIAYRELKSSRTYADVEAKYKKIKPQLSSMSYDGQSWKNGFAFAERATGLDHGEVARVAAIKQLGFDP